MTDAGTGAARVTSTGQLLQVVPETTAPLSRHYANRSYQATPAEVPKWTKTSATTKHCDECAMLQHETGGRFGPRKQPKHRRGFPGGPVLYLCSLHAQAWRDRDTADIKRLTRSGNPHGNPISP